MVYEGQTRITLSFVGLLFTGNLWRDTSCIQKLLLCLQIQRRDRNREHICLSLHSTLKGEPYFWVLIQVEFFGLGLCVKLFREDFIMR